MLDFVLEPLGQVYIQRSLLEMALIAGLCGVISSYVVLRGVAFLSHAMSHAIFPGIVLAFLLHLNIFWGGLAAGLVVVLGISLTTRSTVVNESSATGVLFTGAFALGVVLVSQVKRSSTSGLETFLFGQLFGISWEDVFNTCGVAGLTLLVLFAVRKELLLASFDVGVGRAIGLPVSLISSGFLVLMTLTVIIGQPAVGNILMVALMITPGATARLLTDRLGVMMGLGVGIVLIASLSGIIVSYHYGLAPGACVVVSLTALFLLALVYAAFRNRRRFSLGHPQPAEVQV